MTTRHSGGTIRRASRQRGAFSVMAIIATLIAITTLGAIGVGNLFYQRRDVQRIADMAALAAVQRMDDACSQPTATATSNAQSNGLNASNGDTINIECGRWDTSANPAPSYYAAATSGTTQLNAAKVIVTRQVPFFFVGPPQTVSAVSTARSTNIDTFSVGATLAALGGVGCADGSAPASGNPGLVNGLIGALLGANLNLNIASYQALACTNVTVGDLVVAAGVGTVDQLLALKLTLPQLIQLMVNAATKTAIANASLQASIATLQAILNANVPGTSIGLGGAGGLLNVALADTQAALNAQVDLLDLLLVGAEIAATGKPAVAVNVPSVNLGGLTGTQLQVQIISPPSIGVGEGGIDPATGTWRTKASTAAVGVYLNVYLGTAQLPLLGALLALLNVNVDVNLPIYLQAGTGTATLNSTQCASTQAASTVVITAQPGVANLCIGKPPLDSSGKISLSSNYSCTSPAQIINSNVLGLAQLTVSMSNISVQVQGASQSHTFSGVPGIEANYWTVNSNALGSALSSALTQLAAANITVNLGLFGANVLTVPGNFVSTLLSFLSGLLGPLLSSLDAVLVPLLNLLGVQVGAATIHQISLNCGVAQTVY
ncbi:TadG family pilus assembly protein [Burkholderia sp. AU32262]|uniref:TadG family pilus assembly protein n=1 Tax=Burkholderia sp. AU32262 TaxID=2879630 RepID=UPI001CF1E56D|nr:TadG family pilus assembly protein [Burkholderia sp. AU32262]MCA8241125.1 pilus assembly protein TadG-related protein [Burkholderia sp. AU32262]